jgi:hypothetical protein
MDSHFWDIYRDIRSLIQKPDEAEGSMAIAFVHHYLSLPLKMIPQ